jgi:UDP-N-acetylmuramate-alanine ligase
MMLEWENIWCFQSLKDEAPRANARDIFSSFGGAKSAEAEDGHSSTVLWFDYAHHPESVEGRPWSSAKEDKRSIWLILPLSENT